MALPAPFTANPLSTIGSILRYSVPVYQIYANYRESNASVEVFATGGRRNIASAADRAKDHHIFGCARPETTRQNDESIMNAVR